MPAEPGSPDTSRFPDTSDRRALPGQPALVTSAGSGIGRAAALGLARAGADAAVNETTHPATADEVVHEIEAVPVPGGAERDVSTFADLDHVCRHRAGFEAVRRHGVAGFATAPEA